MLMLNALSFAYFSWIEAVTRNIFATKTLTAQNVRFLVKTKIIKVKNTNNRKQIIMNRFFE